MGEAAVERSGRTELDVLYLTDLRFPGGSSSSLVEETVAAVNAGYRVGALQCRSTSLRRDRTFHPSVRGLIDDGRLVLVRPDEPVDCRLAVVKHPTVLRDAIGGRLNVWSDERVVFVGQVPQDRDGTFHYVPSDVHDHVTEALGGPAVWHPVSPVVRRSLKGTGVPLAEADWVEVIDPTRYSVDRSGPSGEVPVIGRHGRPSVLKWPGDAATLAEAYPTDGSATVRVLGGVDGLEGLLDEVPDRWEVLPFGAMDAADFLAGVDFFVYFHHPDLVEAFGRTVIEALASGCVVVLPPHFEDLFGEACWYVESAGVGDLVASLHRDSQAWLEASERGRRVVDERFSHVAHVARLGNLIGGPSSAVGRAAPTGRMPAGLREQRPRVLVSCVGMDAAGVAGVVRSLVTQRDRATGFAPVLVTTEAPPDVAEHLDEEFVLNPKLRRFTGSRSGLVVEVVPSRSSHDGPESWEDHLLGRLREIRRAHRIDSVTVADLAQPDAWLSLQASAG